jgi:ATP-dependent Clp protease ATP-binding subunit ClpC
MVVNEFSVGLNMAWQIAAGEARVAKHQYIEKEHILIGICSLEKVLRRLEPATPQVAQAFLVEREAVEDMLRAFELDPTQLRRQVRERLGVGSYEHKNTSSEHEARTKARHGQIGERDAER